MNKSLLAVFPQLRRFALRQFLPCIVTASLCWGAAARAQEKEKAAPAQSQPPFPVPILRQSVLSNNYLKPLLELRSHEQEYLGSRFAEPYIESVVLANAYLGEYPAAYEYEEKWYARFMASPRKRNAEDLKSSPIDGYSARDALSAIASVASARQIVVINEEHRTPVHRAFTLQLLSRLYAEGFRYFAAETLFEADADLNTRKYPLQTSGFYISDPVYGDLVRTAGGDVAVRAWRQNGTAPGL